MWVVVRPKPKLLSSVNYFNRHGLSMAGFAPIDIVTQKGPLDDLKHCLAITQRCPFDTIIVTSTEAANRLLPLIDQSTMASTQCICIGDSTYNILAHTGLHCITPPEHNSEGILAMSELLQPGNKRFAIIKGEGGRDLIATSLVNAGAMVTTYDVYSRQPLVPAFTTQAIEWAEAEGIWVTSQSLLDALLMEVSLESLQHVIFVGASERICDHGRNKGIEEFHSSHGATDAHLLGWLHRQGRGLT